MQPQDQRCAQTRERILQSQLEAEPPPELSPRQRVAFNERLESRRATDPLERFESSFGDRIVPARSQADDLFDDDFLAFSKFDRKKLFNSPLLGASLPVDVDRIVRPRPVNPRAGGLGDPNLGLHSLDLERDRLLVGLPFLPRFEVKIVQCPVARNPRVSDLAVQTDAESDGSRPVDSAQGCFQSGKVRMPHVYEPALPKLVFPSFRVLKAHLSQQKAILEVERLPAREYIDLSQVKPLAVT